MDIGSQVTGKLTKGGIYLTVAEWEQFIAGKPITKQSADSMGEFTVTLKLTRKRKRQGGLT